MQRARRLALIPAIAAVGVLALSGCRAEPGVAAYVSDHRVTEESVSLIVDELQPREGDQPKVQLPTRGQIVTTLILGEVCQRLSTEKGYRAQEPVSAEQVAGQLGVPADAVYPQRVAELYTCLSGIPAGAPVAPTDEEMAELVATGKAAGAIPPEMSVAEAAAQLDGQQLRTALANKKMLVEAVTGYHVTVNPRYRPLEFPVLSFQRGVAAVSVPLGEGDSGAVTDISTPEAPSPDAGA